MYSQPAGRLGRFPRTGDAWPFIGSVVLTCISFAGVLSSTRPRNGWWRSTASVAAPTTEQVVFFTPREITPDAIAAGPLRPPRKSRYRAPSAHTTVTPEVAPRLDSRLALPTAAGSAVEAAETNVPFDYPSPRLARPLRHEAPWYNAPRRQNPFGSADLLTSVQRDSVLRTLGSDVPALAANRVQTTSERDDRAKEAMLKMRLTGRVLLVPPDNTGGLITSSLPLFGRGPSKPVSARERLVLDENRARLERLRQRADSMR